MAKGWHHGEESRRKMSVAHKGKPNSQEHNRNISAALKGKPKSEEARQKLRGAGNPMFGKRLSPEARALRSAALTGRHPSDATKQKLRDCQLGEKSPMWGKRLSDATRAKISAKLRGERHPNWHGGKSREEYGQDWTETLRRSIRERDHYTCRLCGFPQTEQAHPVHHIDYDKTHCDPSNLITLCAACHNRTNHHHGYWAVLISELMQNQGLVQGEIA